MSVIIKCLICEIIIQYSPSRIGRKKFCSKKCKNESMKGHSPWNKGLSKQYHLKSDKFSSSQKARWANYTLEKRKSIGKNISKSKLGFKFSVKSKEKMRNAQLGKKQSEEHIANKLKAMRKFFSSKQPTSIEIKLYEELKNRGLLFETQKYVGNRFIVDAYVPSLNLVIEADGDYWHSLEKVKQRDNLKDEYLKKQGFNILRLTETEIKNDRFKERIN